MISLTVGKDRFELKEGQLRELFIEISIAERKVRKDLTNISDKIATLDNLSFMLFRRTVALEMLKLSKLSSQDLFDICFDIVIVTDEIKKLDVSVHENLELAFDLKKLLAEVKQKKEYQGFLGRFTDASHKYHHDPEFLLLVYLLQDDLNEYFKNKKVLLGFLKKSLAEDRGSFANVLHRLDYTLEVALEVVAHESGSMFLEMMKDILKHGVSPNVALIEAVKRCDVEFVDELLAANANPNAIAENGDTLLDICVDKGEVIVAEMLLEKDADPNLQNREGETPLLRACKEDNMIMVDLLLVFKADPNIEDHSFNTPLIAASDRDNLGIVDLLNKKGVNWKNMKILFRAGAKEKRRKYIEILIALGVTREDYINEVEKNVTSADDITIQNLKEEYVLVSKDMNNKKGYKGVVTPDNEQEGVNGVDKQYKLDEFLVDAVVKKDVEKLKEALEKGANPNMENPKGLNNTRIIHLVVWHGDIEMLKLIHQYEADLNIQDVNGDTAIFFSVYKENQVIFKYLLENGADIYMTNNSGVSAYDLIIDRKLDQFSDIFASFKKKEGTV